MKKSTTSKPRKAEGGRNGGSRSLDALVSSAPLPGDKAVQNGYELTVHFVEAGQVFYVKYREGSNSDHWNEETCTYDGYCGNYRVPLERWREGTATAKCSRTA